MKKVLLVIFTVVFTFVVNAQTFSDDFTGLTTSSNLATQSSWTKGGSGPDVTVANATPLTYAGYNSGGGEYVVMPAGTSTSSRVFKLYTPITSYAGSTFYFSFLLRLTATSASSVGYFMTLGDATGSTSFLVPKIFATTNGAGYSIGLSKQTTSLANGLIYGSTVLNLNQTYLVLVRYTFNASGQAAPEKFDDEAYLWINPTGSSEPTTGSAECTATVGGTVGTGDSDFDGFNPIASGVGSFIWNNRGVTNPAGAFDGVRIGWGATSAAAWTNLNAGPLPVELTSFTAVSRGKNVELKWNTATETNNSGFDVEKNVSGSWSKIGFVEGNGTSNAPKSYSFVDASAKGTVSYRLKQIDRDGKFEYSNVVEATVAEVKSFGLDQNYPNPFNPATVISYQIPMNSHVTLKVYDMLGKEVASLVNGAKEAGSYSATFDGSSLSSGIYFYTLRAGNSTSTKKLMLMK